MLKKGVWFLSLPFILNEIESVLIHKFGWDKRKADVVLQDVQERTILIKPTTRVSLISAKQDDNRILEFVLTAKADLLISGDKKHILSLKKNNGTKTTSTREFLKLFS